MILPRILIMVPFAIVTLVTALLATGMGVFIQLYGKGHRAAFPLALYSYGIAVWALGKFLLWGNTYPAWDVFFARLSIAGAIGIPAFFMSFVLRFLNEEVPMKKVMVGIFLFAGALACINIGPWIVSGVAVSPNGYAWPVRGGLYYAYMGYFIAPVLLGIWRLSTHLTDPDPHRRNQVRYIFLAAFFSSIGSGAAFAIIFGYPVPPVLLAFIPLYIPIAFLAIWRHHLLDIELIVRKGIIYSIALGLATAAYLFSLFLLRDLLKGVLPMGAAPLSLLVAVLAVVMFEPIRKQIERWVDEVFYREQVRVEKELSQMTQKLQRVLDIEEMVRSLLLSIVQSLSSKGIALYLRDMESHALVFQGGIGMEKENVPDMDVLARAEQPVHIRDVHALNLPWRMWCAEQKVELVVPIRARSEFVGILLLREKRNGAPYTLRDMSILRLSLTQIAVAMENARLHAMMMERERELAHTHRLATVGSMAAGLAHEAKNPLAAIKGMTGVLRDNLDDPEFLENFSRTVPAQIDRIQQLLERFLRVGRRDQKSEALPLPNIIQEVLRLTEFLARRQRVQVHLQNNAGEDFLVPKEECTQIYLNLILNALQAMPEGGTLTIRLSRMEEDMVCEITDTGPGIPIEKQPIIFEAFYTTRTDGTGLGLFVVRNHVMALGGTIELQSIPGEGTTFLLRLPVKKESRILNPQAAG